MAQEFDAVAAGQQLKTLVVQTGSEVQPLLPPAIVPPLFRTLKDGSVVDRHERVLRGPVEPLPAKVK